jgi:hypothetical protein
LHRGTPKLLDATTKINTELLRYYPPHRRSVSQPAVADQPDTNYASQQHRRYANAGYVRNLARMHGVNVNREYAEVFQVYRVVA